MAICLLNKISGKLIKQFLSYYRLCWANYATLEIIKKEVESNKLTKGEEDEEDEDEEGYMNKKNLKKKIKKFIIEEIMFQSESDFEDITSLKKLIKIAKTDEDDMNDYGVIFDKKMNKLMRLKLKKIFKKEIKLKVPWKLEKNKY